jgi:hypothetical protein
MTKRVPWSKPEEYMMVSPSPASSSTAASSGPSNPRNMGSTRCHQGGVSKAVACMDEKAKAQKKNGGGRRPDYEIGIRRRS